MAKYTISIISLVLITQLKATRLLQQVTCASTLCMIGTQCYDTVNGPVCCDPNICQKGKCGGNGLLQCEPDYQCVAGNCPKGMTDCPGNCINPNAKPQIGDSCTTCRQPLCACNICPDRQNVYGCCGGCSYKDDGNGNVICASEPIIPETNCAYITITPTEGSSCGVQGIDCDKSLAVELTCSDGTCYGNCGTCTYQQDEFGNLHCLPVFISQESVCPIQNCAGLKNCDSYTPDGCNTCGCPNDGSYSFCILKFCPPELVTKPECIVCSDGYTLNPITKQCEPKATCASAICLYGETCYETINGPACCKAEICQNGICGTSAGFECPVGYECVENPENICDPITTADCPGVCVDIDAIYEQSVGCGIDNCNRYFDGCNECFCNFDGTECTEKACKQLLAPYCTGCEPGYILNPSTNQCGGCICPAVFMPVCCNGQMYSNSCSAACQQAIGPCVDGACLSSTTLEPTMNMCCDPNDKPGFNGNPICFEGAGCCPSGKWTCSIGDGYRFGCGDVILDSFKGEMGLECCGGFSNCKNYYDGCNDCSCGENGMDACTKRRCLIQGESKCNECEFEYRVNDEIGECVAKKSCNSSNECDVGFRCRVDPMCRGQRNSNPLCMNAPKVCFDYDSRNCESDLDCDVANGYKCYGVNNQGNGGCGKYE